MISIEEALHIALTVHGGKLDKEGKPYILHPLTVMHYVNSLEEKILALLHDTVEDSDDPQLHESIYASLDSELLKEALQAITRNRDKETYREYIRRLAKNPLARKVKLADLGHNISRCLDNKENLEMESLLIRYYSARGYLAIKEEEEGEEEEGEEEEEEEGEEE